MSNEITRKHYTRFRIVPSDIDLPEKYYFSNTKNFWTRHIAQYFSDELLGDNPSYETTISNAAFRICGIEVKCGLLIADQEAKIELLGGVLRTPTAIDLVLALYGVFEGLGTLLFLHQQCSAGTSLEKFSSLSSRNKKFVDGINTHMGSGSKSILLDLISLRDRCIHQDGADLKNGTDYKELFQSSKIAPPVELLDLMLRSFFASETEYPQSPISEFPIIMKGSVRF